ncbi:hypothetical protein DXG01_017039 [Tephrocybe rancida]|nr:hypothetical protein DXG01_017039 [Tephrocybe rancida]
MEWENVIDSILYVAGLELVTTVDISGMRSILLGDRRFVILSCAPCEGLEAFRIKRPLGRDWAYITRDEQAALVDKMMESWTSSSHASQAQRAFNGSPLLKMSGSPNLASSTFRQPVRAAHNTFPMSPSSLRNRNPPHGPSHYRGRLSRDRDPIPPSPFHNHSEHRHFGVAPVSCSHPLGSGIQSRPTPSQVQATMSPHPPPDSRASLSNAPNSTFESRLENTAPATPPAIWDQALNMPSSVLGALEKSRA